MPEFSRPKEYIDKLRFVERTVKAASYRQDKTLAMRELCEAVLVLTEALIEQEEKASGTSNPNTTNPAPAA